MAKDTEPGARCRAGDPTAAAIPKRGGGAPGYTVDVSPEVHSAKIATAVSPSHAAVPLHSDFASPCPVER